MCCTPVCGGGSDGGTGVGTGGAGGAGGVGSVGGVGGVVRNRGTFFALPCTVPFDDEGVAPSTMSSSSRRALFLERDLTTIPS